ncbi:hypothetical protein [Hyphomicrobium sulfonivorans]|uniref:hypothetical protein n=1 Tax=Hyphomicrobium sulfonivorans TaxID=121290 RepID=UPI00156DAE21|nr:hypothetical protein [Hyphomicrobium sulfonivorans]MBI1649983.1 hypothetical protein [Hyphomicrobium sulfonivorans]NSL72901.1 hypothetical protein [Hyphomicrobium sulfonivorans]
MRLGTTAFVATVLAGFFYVTIPSASALPSASRADIVGKTATSTAEEVRYHRRKYRGYRGYYGGPRYRPYRYYGGPRYYRPYRYGGYGPRYYRRPGFGIYLGF